MEALAVKYRPKTWEDVTEQKSIIKILSTQVETGNVRNAYLFSGASGTGKTTTARIFAKMLNKGVGEPIEIDAASNSGVDNVRVIIQQATERSLVGTYKIYILDECHMLSTAAFNALLKIIEEPPTYTIFILCTTDPQKIPATILNRVQRYNFTRISLGGIYDRLVYICNQEHITYDANALEYISRISDGGMREAISLLDKCIAFNSHISLPNVLTTLGNYSYDSFFELINYLLDDKEKEVLEIIQRYYDDGNDLKLFVNQFFTFIMDVNKYILFKSYATTKIPSTYVDSLNDCANITNAQQYYLYVLDKLLVLKNQIKDDSNLKTTIEVSFLQIARCIQ